MSEVRFDVPVPEKKEFGAKKYEWGFENMTEVGAFLFFPNIKVRNVWSGITYFKKKNPECVEWKFIVRSYEENGMVGTGVWRES